MKPWNGIATAVALAGILLQLAPPTARADFSLAAVYRRASASVVVVFAGDARGGGAWGAGSVVSVEGRILTSDLLIVDPETGKPFEDLRVCFKPRVGSRDWKRDLQACSPARVVARDPRLGLALIQAGKTPSGIPVLALADSERLGVGATLAALGHPDGGGPWVLTPGTLASREKHGDRELFATDIATGSGNRGGPLLDEHATLIGLSSGGAWLDGRLIGGWLEQQGLAVGSSKPAVGPAVTSSPTVEAPPLLIAHGSMKLPPKRRGGLRAFKGPKGQEMYGIPRRDFSLASFQPGLE
jgi:putative serine protease PepD